MKIDLTKIAFLLNKLKNETGVYWGFTCSADAHIGADKVKIQIGVGDAEGELHFFDTNTACIEWIESRILEERNKERVEPNLLLDVIQGFRQTFAPQRFSDSL